MPRDTLYVKIKCLFCKGSKLLDHGHHDPSRPYRWKHCPYCDINGLILIEACNNVIIDYLLSLNELDLKLILDRLDKS
jgi:hypothetical protein